MSEEISNPTAPLLFPFFSPTPTPRIVDAGSMVKRNHSPFLRASMAPTWIAKSTREKRDLDGDQRKLF